MDGLKARLSFDAVAYDYDDEYLTIDTDTHIININNVSRLFGVQYDGNSKLIKFRIRNKLSDIQKMRDSIVYINWIDSKGVKGQSIAINKTINNDTFEFAWKVPFDALKNSGVLHFAMSAVVTKNSSSVIDQRWSTQIASVITPDGIYIKSYTPSSEEEDRIAQIYNELSKMINTQSENLQSQVNLLKEDVEEQYFFDWDKTPMKHLAKKSIVFSENDVKERSMIDDTTGEVVSKYGLSTIDRLFSVDDKAQLFISANIVVKLHKYDSNGTYLKKSTTWHGNQLYTVPDEYKYFRIVIRAGNNGEPDYSTAPITSNIINGGLRLYNGSFPDIYAIYEQISNCNLSEMNQAIQSFISTQTPNNILNRGNYITWDEFNTIRAKSELYYEKLSSCSQKTYQFIFFTDPHCWYNSITDYFVRPFALLHQSYGLLPIDDVYCGGDIVLDPGTSILAIKQIGYTKSLCNHLFHNFYPAIGNHEVDEQYGNLADAQIKNCYTYPYNLYYTIENNDMTSIILNSGGESNHNDVINSQLDYVFNSIKNAKNDYIGVFIHIIYDNSALAESGIMTDGAKNLVALLDACNNKTSVSFLGKEYDFSNVNKKVVFLIGGHTHSDSERYSDSGIPIITTRNFAPDTNSANFDSCILDMENKKIYAIRFGDGEDREFTIPS